MVAALIGAGWPEAMDALAAATGGTGAVLMSYRRQNLEAALPSAGLEELYRRYQAGDAPCCSRLTRVNLSLEEGFRVDHDDYTDAELAQDPWYQEFLKPQRAFWNAVAKLSACEDELGIELSFKRELEAGPYGPDERAALNAILPDIRAAARVAGDAFDVVSIAIGRQLQSRGGPVFELDAWCRVRRVHGQDHDPSLPVQVVGQRLIATDPSSQASLDRVVLAVVGPPRHTAVALLRSREGRRYVVQCLPVLGAARDVFLTSVAVAVLIPACPRPNRWSLDPSLLREAFGLTYREAEIAALLADGIDLAEISLRLDIDPGTARNHLKSIFLKSGTHRQGELIALLARLRP
jgi:DNA-binding CsgD family transcriptional regulator